MFSQLFSAFPQPLQVALLQLVQIVEISIGCDPSFAHYQRIKDQGKPNGTEYFSQIVRLAAIPQIDHFFSNTVLP